MYTIAEKDEKIRKCNLLLLFYSAEISIKFCNTSASRELIR